MQKYNLYSVFDVKAGVYSPVTSSLNDETAKRDFKQLIVDPKARYGQSPKDYTLCCVAQFDDSNAALNSSIYPIMTGLEALAASMLDHGEIKVGLESLGVKPPVISDF
ncbi:MAG: nonstructural protein [Microvirus sp.]|nr:MAG: nonstructural protein [Microvirus sp.]